MAKKRKTLPKDFEELLKEGSLQGLKEVFDKCELDARGGYGKQTALAYDNCPHELAIWLIEQGADLQATDTWGNTPLHSRSRSIFGNIKSLLELGADVHYQNKSIGTPLHAAADSHNVENTTLLLEHGAQIDILNSMGYTPLEQALMSCSNIDITKTARISKIYLNAGVQITSAMRAFVIEIGKRFEFQRANFNKDAVVEVSNALDELYSMFGVDPVAKRILHDGKSQITANASSWQDQHQELWDLLVPASGPAETIQGEVIRIVGRIGYELEDNGGINWDEDYKKMADAFLSFVKQGEQLSSSELTEAEEIVKEVKRKSGDTARMCELGVKWVIDNPLPLKLPPVTYKR
ncbi:ankyrin repeat domain-containing protein [Chitinophaga filiformis]|uniref:ankyrin repeat domain-containing protein n=1 Tax=Chitinophaga filiformis TaxID=104663 RepID=UPI001F26301F|nr:ankyrin repeat domain-containing protein [Chitinophaga filiformis]MCF6406824.1 ankyrin repeat domain-containing protein [Chitinophaga filiformis]